MTNSKYQGAVDLTGATVSLLCVLHCALTPLIFISKPILDSATITDGGLSGWEILDWGFLILSVGAVWYSAKHTLHQSLGYLLWIFWICGRNFRAYFMAYRRGYCSSSAKARFCWSVRGLGAFSPFVFAFDWFGASVFYR